MRLMSDADEGDVVIFVECYLSFVRPGSAILLKHRSDALESSVIGQRVSFTYKAYRVQSLGTPSRQRRLAVGFGLTLTTGLAAGVTSGDLVSAARPTPPNAISPPPPLPPQPSPPPPSAPAPATQAVDPLEDPHGPGPVAWVCGAAASGALLLVLCSYILWRRRRHAHGCDDSAMPPKLTPIDAISPIRSEKSGEEKKDDRLSVATMPSLAVDVLTHPSRNASVSNRGSTTRMSL